MVLHSVDVMKSTDYLILRDKIQSKITRNVVKNVCELSPKYLCPKLIVRNVWVQVSLLMYLLTTKLTEKTVINSYAHKSILKSIGQITLLPVNFALLNKQLSE